MNGRLNMSLAEALSIEEAEDAKVPTCDKCGEKLYEWEYWEVLPWQKWCRACAEEYLDSCHHKIE